MVSQEVLDKMSVLMGHIKDDYNHQIRKHLKVQVIETLNLIDTVLSSFTKEDYQSHILGEYLGKIKDKYVEMLDIANRLDNEFMLFIMGSGKNGKSTLVNALLNQDLAEVNMLPKTWKIDIFKGATSKEKNTAEIRYKSGKSPQKKTKKEAQKLIEQEETKQKKSQKNIRDAVKAYKESHSIEETEEYKRQQTKYGLYKSDISEVIWHVNGSDILKDYCLVDTPGLNQELDGDMVIASAKDYYHKADGVIWLLPADKIAGISDRSEMDKLIKSYGKRNGNMIAVVGKMDRVKGKEKAILDEARKIYGDILTEFIPISALQATEAMKKLNNLPKGSDDYKQAEEEYINSGMPVLLDHLRKTLYENRANIQVASKQKAIGEIFNEIRKLISDIVEIIDKENIKRIKLSDKWEKDSQQARETANQNIRNYCKSRVDEIERAVNKVEDELWDMTDGARNRRIKEIIDPKRLENEISSKVEENSASLKYLYNRLVKQSTFSEFPHLKEQDLIKVDGSGKKIDVRGLGDVFDTENGQFIAGGALAFSAAAILGPIGIAFAALAFTDFGKGVVKWLTRSFSSSISSKVRKSVDEQLSKACTDLMVQYDSAMKATTGQIVKVRESSFAKLYGDSKYIEPIKQKLNQIQSLSNLRFEDLSLSTIIINSRREL